MFTYPFAYNPTEKVKEESEKLLADESVVERFAEGKMLGVLITDKGVLKAFSGKGLAEGYAPPLLDSSEVVGASAEESAMLQKRIFAETVVHNALGEAKSILDIFAERGLVPPSGTGDCAAPKMLEEAYRRGWTPLSMGEFWCGASPRSGEVREHGRFYPSCTGKCGPLLSFMMQGLEVEPSPLCRPMGPEKAETVYCDEYLIVANKPSGMLCVPGKTGAPSLMQMLPQPVYEVHRLDMDTSGLIVFARNPQAQAALRAQFERREVQKTYLAHLVPGKKHWTKGFKGTIALPLGQDWDDRPRQMIDRKAGKPAITRFEILDVFPDGSLDVLFEPLTGRTHQLRVHAASPEGLGHPIQGDRLYGAPDGGRLMLHASRIAFRHPASGAPLHFEA